MENNVRVVIEYAVSRNFLSIGRQVLVPLKRIRRVVDTVNIVMVERTRLVIGRRGERVSVIGCRSV